MAASEALERTIYLAAAPFLGMAASLPPGHPIADTVNWTVGTGAAAAVVVVAAKARNEGRWLTRLSPLALAAAVDVAAHHVPGAAWDWGLAGAWALVFCAFVPLSRTSRGHRRRALTAAAGPVPQILPAAPQPVAAAVADDGADHFTRQARTIWEQAGSPSRTHVVVAKPHPGKQHDLTLLLRSSEPGRPISGLKQADVAAAFGVHESDVLLVETTQMAGRQAGPGWLEAQVIPDERKRRRQRPTLAEWWEDGIGRNAIPGSKLDDRIRNDERQVTYWTAHLPESMGEPRIDLVALCRALGTTYDAGEVFTVVDGNNLLVTHWDVSPLAKVYPATVELLTPDANGWYTTGFLANGQPARNRVHTDRGAAHGLLVAPSGGGKTQVMALQVAANAHWGAVIWLVTEAPDEKTAALGEHCDKYGIGALYMVRAMRAMVALIDIRGRMVWADGRIHDWEAGKPGCPYRPLAAFWDEFLSAATGDEYGNEVERHAVTLSVKGRKYALGETLAGQSCYVHDGFPSLLLQNLRANGIPVALDPGPKKVTEMMKALSVAADDIPDPLPRSFAKTAGGRIERIMQGEAEPPTDSNTGGAGWIVPIAKPETMRTLFMDFSEPIAPLFPDAVFGLTDYEIKQLTVLGLWFDWDLPPQPGEFGDEEDEDDLDDFDDEPKSRTKAAKGKGAARGGGMAGRSNITSPQDALAALRNGFR
ncbi:chromosome segregation protein ParM [Kitasatospora sp. NPDC101801]|uniref:chromosome segregation protein ParM n=1 Tax=Kitasatospora sp. NPDC101801 TaxID=3364103 RepID=UPI0037F408E2